MRNRFIFCVVACLVLFSCDILKTKEGDCVIAGSITVQEDFAGDIKFLGEIKNQGTGKANYVNITFTMKDSGGNVIDTDFTYTNPTHLDAGQTGSFECYTAVAYADVASWTYIIEWDNES